MGSRVQGYRGAEEALGFENLNAAPASSFWTGGRFLITLPFFILDLLSDQTRMSRANTEVIPVRTFLAVTLALILDVSAVSAQDLKSCNPQLSADGTIAISLATTGDRDACTDPIITKTEDFYVGLTCKLTTGAGLTCSASEPSGIEPELMVNACARVPTLDLETLKNQNFSVDMWSMKDACIPEPLHDMIRRTLKVDVSGISYCLSPGNGCVSIMEITPSGFTNLLQIAAASGLGWITQWLFPDGQRA